MSEVNQNLNSFDAQSDSELVKTIELTFHEVVSDEAASQTEGESSSEEVETSNRTECGSQPKLDWHGIAHKLREHNRKLLKQVFQLEQEKADLETRLERQLQQAYASDSAIAKQGEEIALLSEQLEIALEKANSDRDCLDDYARQLEISQKQTARLERECALLQENHNEQTFQLIDKDKQIQELSAHLNRLQRDTPLYASAIDKYELPTSLERKSSKSAITRTKSKPIQVWSGSVAKDNIPLPEASSRALKPEPNQSKTANWLAPAIAPPKQTKKIKSLAAVELPQFPRQN